MPNTKHGHFHWNELMTRNVEGAKDFHAAVLGWTYEQFPMGDGVEYTVCMSDGVPVAGIFEMLPGQGMDDLPDHWFSYIAVDDVDARLRGVGAAGGVICREPADVPDVGRFCVVQDTCGAVVGWITPAPTE